MAGRGYNGRGRRFQRRFPARLEGDGGRPGGAAVGVRPGNDGGDQGRGQLDALGRGRHSTKPATHRTDHGLDQLR